MNKYTLWVLVITWSVVFAVNCFMSNWNMIVLSGVGLILLPLIGIWTCLEKSREMKNEVRKPS